MHRTSFVFLLSAMLAGGIGAARADVTLFGHLDQSWVAVDQDGGNDDQFLECTTCSVGFKGSEDLGNGLRAIFKLDFQFDMNNRNANGSLTDRDQWLGMSSSFGQVRVGTISTVYKSHGAALDPLYRTSQQGRDRGLQSNLHRGAGSAGQGRAENTARYDSPSWNGLKFAATYTLVPDDNTTTDDNGYGAGISYENGGILVFADYITNDSGDDDSAWKVGGKYTFNNFAFMGQYERDDGLISSKASNTSGDGADIWHLGASYTLGNSMLYFGYGNGSSGSGGSNSSDYFAWTLAGVHNMSKRTSLYAGFSEIDCDDPGDDVCRRVGSDGGEDDKFSVGMKHKF